jgi:hypothetical protein
MAWVCGGTGADLYVPRALAVLAIGEEPRTAWRDGWEGVAPHMFLPWAAQMLSLLESAEGDAIVPCLEVAHT